MERVRNLFGVGRSYEAQEDDHTSATDGASGSTPTSSAAAATAATEDAERGFLAEALDASSLSWSTRIQGFLACFVLGVFIAVLAAVMFSLTFNFFTFGILYTLGNVVAVASTLFLMGPMNQVHQAMLFTSAHLIAASCLVLQHLIQVYPYMNLTVLMVIKRMFSKERWLATSAMLLFLVLTLLSAFALQKRGLTILMVVLQFLAMTWYCLSYIPFARDAVIKFVDKIIS